MAKPHKGLGKGFDALIPVGLDVHLLDDDESRVQDLFISKIKPNPEQPRTHFDDDQLEELAASIKRHGVLQPLIVTPAANGYYTIIAGERRWRAAQIASLQQVPAIVRSGEELENLEIALVENIQRVDLSPLEQAVSIQRLREQFSIGIDDIAKRLGKAVSTVSNIVRLLQLSPAAQQALREERITEGHARSILALKDFPKQQEELLLMIQKHGWSVRQAEQFVTAAKTGPKDSNVAAQKTRAVTPATKALSKVLQRPVSVRHMAKGGRLMITFSSDDDLEKLLQTLSDVKN